MLVVQVLVEVPRLHRGCQADVPSLSKLCHLLDLVFGFHLRSFEQILFQHLLVFHDRHGVGIGDWDVVGALDGAHGRRRQILIRRPQTLLTILNGLFLRHNRRRPHSSTPGSLLIILNLLNPIEQCFIVHHVLDLLPLLLVELYAVFHEIGKHLSLCLVTIGIHERMP